MNCFIWLHYRNASSTSSSVSTYSLCFCIILRKSLNSIPPFLSASLSWIMLWRTIKSKTRYIQIFINLSYLELCFCWIVTQSSHDSSQVLGWYLSILAVHRERLLVLDHQFLRQLSHRNYLKMIWKLRRSLQIIFYNCEGKCTKYLPVL